jgi:xanthine/uracil permease
MIAGRGSVRADGFLDHEYNERRELFGTLRVIAVALAVLAVILCITLYMRQWMAS